MTKMELEFADATVDITASGEVSIQCDRSNIDLTLRRKGSIGHRGDLVRALYEASLEWMVANNEAVDPK